MIILMIFYDETLFEKLKVIIEVLITESKLNFIILNHLKTFSYFRKVFTTYKIRLLLLLLHILKKCYQICNCKNPIEKRFFFKKILIMNELLMILQQKISNIKRKNSNDLGLWRA